MRVGKTSKFAMTKEEKDRRKKMGKRIITVMELDRVSNDEGREGGR